MAETNEPTATTESVPALSEAAQTAAPDTKIGDDSSKPKLQSILHEDFGDDDDDDDEDEGSTKERKSATAPVLRGFLKAKDGALVWMGKWAMSAEQYKTGDKAKFKYTYAGSKDVNAACDAGGKVTNPLSGKYSGYFCLNNADPSKPPTKIKETGIQLKFTPKAQGGTFEVSGKGSNKFGDFSLSGVFEPASARLAIIKAYLVSEYDSDDDGDDEIDDEDEANPAETADELATLQADNELSVEELRAKYAAAAAAAETTTTTETSEEEPKAKRAKTTAD
jgi:hypothetical protein